MNSHHSWSHILKERLRAVSAAELRRASASSAQRATSLRSLALRVAEVLSVSLAIGQEHAWTCCKASAHACLGGSRCRIGGYFPGPAKATRHSQRSRRRQHGSGVLAVATLFSGMVVIWKA